MTGGTILGHGIDLVEIARIDAMIERHGARFTTRCFTEAEQAYADSGRRRRGERYAARFAAKEAVLKALGTGWRDGIRWVDVGVVREPSGRPAVVLDGRCAEVARDLGIDRWMLSLTHAGGYAQASALGLATRAATGR